MQFCYFLVKVMYEKITAEMNQRRNTLFENERKALDITKFNMKVTEMYWMLRAHIQYICYFVAHGNGKTKRDIYYWPYRVKFFSHCQFLFSSVSVQLHNVSMHLFLLIYKYKKSNATTNHSERFLHIWRIW